MLFSNTGELRRDFFYVFVIFFVPSCLRAFVSSWLAFFQPSISINSSTSPLGAVKRAM